jgi:hypothetical protein
MENPELNGASVPDTGDLPSTPSNLEVHIEEVVLHGFSAGDRFRIGDALQRELARLLAQQGLPAPAVRSASIDRLDGGSFPVAPGSGPRAIGTQVAKQVYRQIAPSRNEASRRARSRPDRSGP